MAIRPRYVAAILVFAVSLVSVCIVGYLQLSGMDSWWVCLEVAFALIVLWSGDSGGSVMSILWVFFNQPIIAIASLVVFSILIPLSGLLSSSDIMTSLQGVKV